MAVLVGALGVGTLIAWQTLGPDLRPSRIGNTPAAHGEFPNPAQAGGDGRTVWFADGKKAYNLSKLPHLGSPDAPLVFAEYYDYTCDACRRQHADIKALLAAEPDRWCVILLPVPLDGACNRHLPTSIREHPGACGLARLALAVWKENPRAFPGYHDLLFDRLDPAVAKTEALRNLTPGALELAMIDPWIADLLRENCEDYRRLCVQYDVLPKILAGRNGLLHGTADDRESFFREIHHLATNPR